MRRATILTLLLLVLSVGGVCIAASNIYQEHDQVVLSETTLYGDSSATDGLTLKLATTYDRHLFWDTTYSFGENSVTETEYEFHSLPVYDDAPFTYQGLFIDSYPETNFVPGNNQAGLHQAYQELYDSIKSGTEGSRVIRLKDYIDYYPMNISLEFPGTSEYLSAEELAKYEDSEIEPDSDLAAIYQLQEYLKIPVIEDEYLHIVLGKDSNGTVSHYGGGTANGNHFYLNFLSRLTDTACYFTFDAHTENGDVVDTSELPDGFGIYCLPYEEGLLAEDGRDISDIKVNELEMIYPLNPETMIDYLDISPDQAKLLLFTRENQQYLLTVIDLTTCKPLQKIAIFDKDSPDAYYNCCNQGDFIVIMQTTTDEALAVVSVDENNTYHVEFTCDYYPREFNFYNYYPEAFAFDGERLALSGILYDYRNYLSGSCNVYLAVYDHTGLIYYGEYENSLETGIDYENYYEYNCFGRDYNPITLEWKIQ